MLRGVTGSMGMSNGPGRGTHPSWLRRGCADETRKTVFAIIVIARCLHRQFANGNLTVTADTLRDTVLLRNE